MAGAYFGLSVAVVAVGKLGRDLFALRGGRRLGHALASEDNVAVAVEQSLFVLATVVALLGSLVVAGETILDQAADFATTSLAVLVTLWAAEQGLARLVLRGIDMEREVVDQGNVAVATARAGVVFGSALVLRGALGHAESWLTRIAWMVAGQAALLALTWLYQRLTPYDDLAQLGRRNLAAALPLAGIAIAAGLVVDASLRGHGATWTDDAVHMGVALVIAVVLLAVLRWLGDLLLLPGSTYSEEIERDRNVGAGLVEATSYIAGGFAIAYFLT
jgi:uncharacterized membrane protein YjfL (UPF0719 family)